jgi:hypothetical protein
MSMVAVVHWLPGLCEFHPQHPNIEVALSTYFTQASVDMKPSRSHQIASRSRCGFLVIDSTSPALESAFLVTPSSTWVLMHYLE